MRLALDQARIAGERDEVPIGAVVVSDSGRVIASAHNLTQCLCDPTAHAEMQAITAACNHIGGKYLDNCTIFVTIEPCPMCAMALHWAHIGQIVWGADDPKKGFTTISNTLLHPKTTTHKHVLDSECGGIVRDFFEKKRK